MYSSSCTVAVEIRSSQVWPRPCMHAAQQGC
jgi:hypothetical protein